MSEAAPILLACDEPSTARLAVATAARLFRDRPAVIATAWTPAPAFRPKDGFEEYHGIPAPTREEHDQRRKQGAEEVGAEAQRMATEAGLTATATVLSSSDVAQTLADVAESLGAVAIIVGTNDHGIFDVLPLGKVTRRLADLSPIPLVLLPGPTRAEKAAEPGPPSPPEPAS